MADHNNPHKFQIPFYYNWPDGVMRSVFYTEGQDLVECVKEAVKEIPGIPEKSKSRESDYFAAFPLDQATAEMLREKNSIIFRKPQQSQPPPPQPPPPQQQPQQRPQQQQQQQQQLETIAKKINEMFVGAGGIGIQNVGEGGIGTLIVQLVQTMLCQNNQTVAGLECFSPQVKNLFQSTAGEEFR